MKKLTSVGEESELKSKKLYGYGFREKCVLFLVLLFAIWNKSYAQIDYDIEINGLRYTVDVEALTAVLVDVNPSVSNVIVPSNIEIGNRSFEVNKVVLRFGDYDYQFIRSLHLSNKTIELDVGFRNSPHYSSYGTEPFPIINDLVIPNSVKTLSIGCIKGLKTLRIPSSVEWVKKLYCLPDLETLIIDDSPNDLHWSIYSQFEDMTDGFYGMYKVEYIYLGRQFRGTYCFGYHSGVSTSHVCPDTVIIGPYVKDLTDYNLYPKDILIPNTVEKGMVCAYYDTQSIVFEDGLMPYDSVVHPVWGRVIYIGRPYAWIGTVDANQVTIGPTLTGNQAADFFNNVSYTLSVSDTIFLYQVEPPLLTRSFTNATYVNAHLYVPRGYKVLYENAPIWKNFVYIEEFDYEVPEHEILVINNNPEAGSVSGGGTYHFGEIVTLLATPNEGYYFQEWTENGVIVSRDTEYTFGVTGDRRIVASFNAANNNEFVISATSNNSGWGAVSGSGVYHFGETATLSAIPFGTNTFDNWTEDGVWVSNVRDYSFVVSRNRNLVANFRVNYGIEEEEATEAFVIVRDRTLSIIGAEEQSEVLIYNSLGQEIYKGLDRSIPIRNVGVYIVAVENKRIKVIVE